MTQVKYYIRHKETGLPATYETSSNSGGEFCVDTEYTLHEPNDYDEVWYADNKEIAETARITNTGWYNAGFKTPSHSSSFNPSEYEVVRRTFVYTDEVA